MRADHREPVTEDDDDPGVDTGELLRQHDVARARAVRVVRARRCTSGCGTGSAGRRRRARPRARACGDRRRDPGRVGQLTERRQDDAGGPEVRDGAVTASGSTRWSSTPRDGMRTPIGLLRPAAAGGWRLCGGRRSIFVEVGVPERAVLHDPTTVDQWLDGHLATVTTPALRCPLAKVLTFEAKTVPLRPGTGRRVAHRCPAGAAPEPASPGRSQSSGRRCTDPARTPRVRSSVPLPRWITDQEGGAGGTPGRTIPGDQDDTPAAPRRQTCRLVARMGVNCSTAW